MIIFSRSLGPEMFGIFSVLFSLLLILSKVGDFGVNIAVQREISQHKDNPTFVKETIQTGLVLKLALTVALMVFGIIASKWIGIRVLQLEQYYYLVRWVFLLSGAVIFYEYINVILQGRGLFTYSVLTNFIQSIGKFLYAVIFMSVGIALGPLTLVYLLMPLAGGIAGFVKLPLTYFKPVLDKNRAQKIISVAKWTSIAIISATIADNIDVIIVQNYLSSHETGLWSAAVRIATVASLIGWSLGSVLNVRVASYKSKHHLQAYLKKAYLIGVISLVGIMLLTLLSYPAIYYTVGLEYLDAVAPLNLLFISTALLTATSPFVALFYLFNKPTYFAISGILSTIVLLISDVVLIPPFGLIGAGYARIITRLAILIFTLLFAKKSYQEHFSPSKS